MRVKHSILLNAIILVILSTVLCSGTKGTLQTYQTKNRLFTFACPSHWKIDEVNDFTVIVIEPASNEYRARFSLMVQFLPQPVTPKQYLEISLNQLRQIYSDFELINLDSVVSSNTKFLTIEARYTEKGKKLHGYSAFRVGQSNAYIFNGIAEDSKWNNAFESFRASLGSVKIGILKNEPLPKDQSI